MGRAPVIRLISLAAVATIVACTAESGTLPSLAEEAV
jgi:hypothetical protein